MKKTIMEQMDDILSMTRDLEEMCKDLRAGMLELPINALPRKSWFEAEKLEDIKNDSL